MMNPNQPDQPNTDRTSSSAEAGSLEASINAENELEQVSEDPEVNNEVNNIESQGDLENSEDLSSQSRAYPRLESTDNRPNDSGSSPSFPIVGIGASAGGLEAFQTFFRHMDENSGMAFVLISHLSPNHESMLSELLAKETQMSVLQIREETLVQPDRVYVIPPNANLTVDGGILRLTEPERARGYRSPIDVFFRSLAEDQRENAVCIILSGTGSDGTIGLKCIKEFGGLAIAQDSQTAKYDSMPRSAALTGLVDYVLPVEEIPAKLIEYARHRQGLRESLGENGILEETTDRLKQICALLRRRIGHDFSGYKNSTLVRRIQRRIQITQSRSVAAYVEYLKSDNNEINLLFKDLLIGVTHFFRDPESFETLKQKVIVPLVEARQPENAIRVWVTGCSSGEEAYSIAMLLYEEVQRQNVQVPVQIFATDIDERALEIARQARYPENIAEQIEPKRLERFFVKQNGVYQVVKNLREMCIFSRHSLINDPPFSRIDLLSCRNLLIYFDTALQQKLIPLFHYALQPKGYLFLGSSETLTGYGELFRTVDKQHRIFAQKQAIVSPAIDFPLVDRSGYRQLSDRSGSQPFQGRQQQVNRSIERILLQEYSPPCVIINEQNEVIYVFGRTGKYLEPSQGIPSNNLFDLARRGLGLDLRSAIGKATETQRTVVRERISIETEERVQIINLIVRPIREANEENRLKMVIFQDVGVATSYEQAQADGSEPKEESRVIRQLEDELRVTKEHLRSTIEELETSNEELKSANEELLSMNEELQSSNEELQTSKEEMQSINEELETVNAELRNKIEELDAANSDLQNLFESTRIATVFLGRNLRIKKFTPAATRLFNFIETDLGRPITDITLALAGVNIAADVREVLQSLIPIEREVQVEGQSTYYKMRVLPYRTLENAIDGAVITFVDVTDLRRARNKAEQSALRQQAIAELGIYALQNMEAQAICDRAIHIACETLESNFCCLFVDPSDGEPDPLSSSERLLLKSACGWDSEVVGTATVSTLDSFPGYTLRVQNPVIVEDFSQETRFSQSALLHDANATSGLSTVVYGSDRSYGVLAIYSTETREFTPEDISFLQAIANGLAAALGREKTRLALAKSRERLDLALNAGKMGVWEWDIATGSSTWNDMEYQLLGLNPNEIEAPIDEIFYSYVHPDDVSHARQKLEETIATKTEYDVEFRINRADGQLRWLSAHARPIYDADGTAVKVIGVNYDITEQKENEAALQAADRRKNQFLAVLGHELRNPLNALSNSIALMDDLEDSARRAQLSAITNRQLQQLARLIDDLLDISRIVYGKIELQPELINFTQLLSDAIADFQTSLEENALALEFALPDRPIWVNGDRIRLTQAFSNVLSNAIKFSNCGDRIEVAATRSDRLVTVEITDTGIGIEPDALSRIFIAFSQEKRSLARSGGLGLGLPLSKGLIELHNGRMWAYSEGLNGGTKITIELPMAEEPSAILQATLPAAAQSQTVLDDRLLVPDRAIRILVIEDSEDAAILLEFYLTDAGYQVELADNGQSGIERARQFCPDVILSDISLKTEMDGYAVARAIKADPELRDIYLIATSGYGQPTDKAQAKAAGFDEHFTKPLDFDNLVQSISAVLRESR